ncbi:MAG: hypothetical protein JNN18_14620 [Rubrivivax sp.]|nr:hypothetical protein [Rubrivivax sp.]
MTSAVLRAAHTHLYPGARLQADGPLTAGAGLVVVFADHGSAGARVERVEDGRVTLAVAAHRTARGTLVEAKRWLLTWQAGPLQAPAATPASCPTWRVVRRLDDPVRRGL